MEEKKSYQKGLLVGIAGGILGAFMLVSLCVVVGINVFVAKDGSIQFGEIEPPTTVVQDQLPAQEDGDSLLSSEFEAKVAKIYDLLDKNFLYEIDMQALQDGMYAGLLGALGDPYSGYYTEEEYSIFTQETEGIYYGIGVSVSQNVQTGIIKVVKPFKNAPGFEAGLLPEDIIYAINGTEVTGMDLTQAVSMIKGSEGTTVKLTIVREGEADYLEFDVERRQVEIETVEYEMLDNQLGYILVSEFDQVTVNQFQKALTELNKAGMKGLIIDLRNNPGGRMDVVLQMLDMILPEGLLIYTEDKNGNRGNEYYSDAESILNVPLAVLINENSASASEIFAGDIKDFDAGTLIGTTTFGKGIVQTLYPLGDNTAVKITVTSYFTNAGRNIHGIGIDPDITIELDEGLRQKAVIEKSEDNQLQKAIEVLSEN